MADAGEEHARAMGQCGGVAACHQLDGNMSLNMEHGDIGVAVSVPQHYFRAGGADHVDPQRAHARNQACWFQRC